MTLSSWSSHIPSLSLSRHTFQREDTDQLAFGVSVSLSVKRCMAVHPTQLLEVSSTLKFETRCKRRPTKADRLPLKKVLSTLSYLRALRNG